MENIMCRYTFKAHSIKGLNEDVDLKAKNWAEALKAVEKHITRNEKTKRFGHVI